ncbi:MAG: thiol-disulfide isomerase/thioredoxin [Flavobacteriales bacterium]|jgi:thiol-disulfide isomerase/thioredoxin
MKIKKSTWLLLAALLIIGGWFYQRYYIAPAITFDDIKVVNLQGHEVQLNIDRPTVVSFFASWCPPCQQEIQWMNEAHNTMGDEFQFLIVSDEKVTKLLPFERAYQLPILQLTESRKTFGVYSIPTVFIFNKKGELVFNHVGLVDFRDKTNITKYL